jgi:hypothetical protein
MHTVMAADAAGAPLRVVCGYCGSEHHYRGGPRIGQEGQASPAAPGTARPRAAVLPPTRERTIAPMPPLDLPDSDLEALLRRVIREESGLSDVPPAEKWRGGTLVLRPGKPGVLEKSWPIDTFFHKIVMLRNRLRNLEQQVNASDLPDDAKVKLQAYITGCYGSLTSFNVLFADEDDQFKGAGGD